MNDPLVTQKFNKLFQYHKEKTDCSRYESGKVAIFDKEQRYFFYKTKEMILTRINPIQQI